MILYDSCDSYDIIGYIFKIQFILIILIYYDLLWLG